MDEIVEKEMDKTFNEGIDFDPETKTVAYNSSHENYVDISIDNNPTIDGEIVPGVQVWSIFKRKKGETREDGNPSFRVSPFFLLNIDHTCTPGTISPSMVGLLSIEMST